MKLRTGLVLAVMVIFDETKKLIVKFHVVTDSADHSLEPEYLTVLEAYLKRSLVSNIISAKFTAGRVYFFRFKIKPVNITANILHAGSCLKFCPSR